MSAIAQTRWHSVGHSKVPIGERHIAEYQAYILASNGRITRRVDLKCDNDEAAKGAAKQLADGYDVELWQGKYKIETFKHRL
jgi:hypothetical protein